MVWEKLRFSSCLLSTNIHHSSKLELSLKHQGIGLIVEQREESLCLPGTTLMDTCTPFGDVGAPLIQKECLSILLLIKILTNSYQQYKHRKFDSRVTTRDQSYFRID